MDDWFNDPFFGGSGGSGGSRDIQDHFARMEQQMNNMMNSMFRGFDDFGQMGNMRLGFDNGPSLQNQTRTGNTRSQNRFENSYDDIPEAQEASPSRGANRRSRQAPIIEEPDDDDDGGNRNYSNSRYGQSNNFSDSNPHTYFYSSSMSSYYGPDGVQHSKKKTYDSSTGMTEMAEMRRLGNQAVAKKKEIDRNGHVTEMTDTKNLDENEVDDFQRRFRSSYENPSLGFNRNPSNDDYSGSRHHHHHRSLK